MSEYAPVEVTLNKFGQVSDIKVNGHTLAGAVTKADYHASGDWRPEVSSIVVYLDVDHVTITEPES